MTPIRLEELEKALMKESVRRQGLGGYNTDAETLMLLTTALYELIRHLRDTAPKKK